MPPPGFGPKLPKPSQKEAVKAAEAVNPADMKHAMLCSLQQQLVVVCSLFMRGRGERSARL